MYYRIVLVIVLFSFILSNLIAFSSIKFPPSLDSFFSYFPYVLEFIFFVLSIFAIINFNKYRYDWVVKLLPILEIIFSCLNIISILFYHFPIDSFKIVYLNFYMGHIIYIWAFSSGLNIVMLFLCLFNLLRKKGSQVGNI